MSGGDLAVSITALVVTVLIGAVAASADPPSVEIGHSRQRLPLPS
jgi:hypothetical protein